jgi:hypothetical protein
VPVSYMEARTYGIGQLIAERRLLTVPEHQRDYAWTEDIAGTFLDDVVGAMKDDAPDYFAGLIVLIGTPLGSNWSILDGQQRLTTTTLVYAAIRAWLAGRGLTTDAEHLHSQFIGTAELGEDPRQPRLTLNANNRAIFSRLVVASWDEDLGEVRKEEAQHGSNRRLIDAAAACRKRVEGLVEAAGPDEAAQRRALYRFANYLRDNVRVVGMEIPTTDRAYMIFERINAAGLAPSFLDLIKNYLFGLAGGGLASVQDDWNKMIAYLGERRAPDFFRAYWNSQFPPLPAGKLLDQWKGRYATPAAASQLARDLSDAAEQYAALDLPEHALWADYSEMCREQVAALAVLGNRPYAPVILSAFQGLDAATMEVLLGDLVVLAVRNLVTGNRRPRTLEAACARLASKIFTGEVADAQGAWQELASVLPGDEDFCEAFGQYVSAKEPEARYLLVQLERAAGGAAATSAAVRLDRVCPRNPGPAWRELLQAEPHLRGQYLNRLGNLCLLEQKPSAQAAAAGFEKKRAAYGRSAVVLTRQIAEDFTTWNAAAIERRQQSLAEIARRAWPAPGAERRRLEAP